MARAVLDASAILALLQNEAGAAKVAELVHDSLISPANLAEAVGKLIQYGMPADEAVLTVSELGCQAEPTTAGQGLYAGRLYAQTPRGSVSLGDRLCLALASEMRLPVLTAGGAWADLDLGVQVVLIR